jgi:hypothetical protein
LNNLSALLYAGEVHADQFLRTLQRFADDPEPEVVRAVLGGLAKAKLAFLTPDNEAHFAAYVRATLTPALHRKVRLNTRMRRPRSRSYAHRSSDG